MTTISLIQTADVAALKCIFFQLVKNLKEISWYGIDCNVDQYLLNTDLAFSYLQIIDSGCELEHNLQCEIKNFITKNSSFCVFTSDKCASKYHIYVGDTEVG